MTIYTFLRYILISASVASAFPSCSADIYGRPSTDGCNALLLGNLIPGTRRRDNTGINKISARSQLFAQAGLSQRPSAAGQYVSLAEFRHLYPIPKTWYGNGCNVCLAPIDIPAAPQVRGDMNLPFTWDTGRWPVIAATGRSIDHVCVQSQGTNVLPQGGVESTGNRNNILLYLFAPLSKYDNDTKAAVKAGKPIRGRDSDRTTESPAKRLKRLFPTDRQYRGGGEGSAGFNVGGSGFPGHVGNVLDLGSGWDMGYVSSMSFVPLQNAAGGLLAFYDFVTTSALDQISKAINATANPRFTHGPLSLQFSSSTDVVDWSFIVNYAQSMIQAVNSQYTAMYTTITAVYAYGENILAQLLAKRVQ